MSTDWSMNLHPFWAVFHARSNSTGRISNSTGHWNAGQIGWKFIVCLPSRIGYHLNEFNQHLSQWIYSQFDRSNSTGHEILVKLSGNPLYASLVKLGIIAMNSTSIYLNGFTPNLTGRIWPGINLKWSSEEFPVKVVRNSQQVQWRIASKCSEEFSASAMKNSQ